MTRELHDDEVQEWVMDREERTESRRLLVLLAVAGLVVFVGALFLIVYLAVRWGDTGNDAFAWALVVLLTALAVGYAYLFRKHPAGVTRG